jgi:hypothetical protein
MVERRTPVGDAPRNKTPGLGQRSVEIVVK